MATSSTAERQITFEDGLLGITLKRSLIGCAVVSEINQETQARSNGVILNDVVRQVGDRDLRKETLDKKAWLELIDLLKTSPRPLVLVVSTGTEEEIKQKPKKPKSSLPEIVAGEHGAITDITTNDSNTPQKTTNPLQQQESTHSTPTITHVSKSNDSRVISSDNSGEISKPVPPSNTVAVPPPTTANSLPCISMEELSECLEWPSKGPLSKGATSLIGGKRSIEQLLKHGSLKLWANRGWFGGSNLQSRHVFLCNTILLVCEISKEDGKKQNKRKNKRVGDGDWQDVKWVVETAIELEACLIRDVPPKPLQGVGDDELRGAFEITAPVGTLVLVGESNEERGDWVDAIFDAILKTNPEAATKPGWVHQIRSGNLLSAASSCDLHQMCVALEREPPAHLVRADEDEVKLMAVAEDINQLDVNGDSALHLVLKQLDVLRDYYSPTKTNNQRSLNAEAIQKTVAEAVMVLVSAGATISEENSTGKLPLHIAAEFLSDSVLSALLSATGGGAYVNIQDSDGFSPTHMACFSAATSSRQVRHIALLEAKYPDKKKPIPKYPIATSTSVLTSLQRCLGCLKVWGADLELPDACGLTISQRLAMGLHFDVLNVLLSAGADASAITSESGLPPPGRITHQLATSESNGASESVLPKPPPPVSPGASSMTRSTSSSMASPASPGIKMTNEDIAQFPISNLIHLICGSHLIPRYFSAGVKLTQFPTSIEPPASASTSPDELVPTPLFALAETLRVLLSHLSMKHQSNVVIKLINAPSPHCGLSPLQLLLRSRGVPSPSVACAVLVLLIAGADMFGLDPQGHSIAQPISDGLQTHLAQNPMTWHHEDNNHEDMSTAGSASSSSLPTSLDDAAHVVVGTMLLVTKGRLAFMGGGDRERAVHFMLVADSRGMVHMGTNYKGPFLIGLRVKKDELRTSVMAHSVSVKKIDSNGGVVAKRGERVHDAYPICLENATVEAEDDKPLNLLLIKATERLVWEKQLKRAFIKLSKDEMRKQQLASNQRELFGASADKKDPGAVSKNQRVEGSANDTVNVMNQNKNAMLERGEKLNDLADKTQELSDTASEFEKMCKELEKQQKNRWF